MLLMVVLPVVLGLVVLLLLVLVVWVVVFWGAPWGGSTWPRRKFAMTIFERQNVPSCAVRRVCT